jgi:hypothetical protein
MYAILYLPTGEYIKHSIYNIVLELDYEYDAQLWVKNNRFYMKTDTIMNIDKAYHLEIVKIS